MGPSEPQGLLHRARLPGAAEATVVAAERTQKEKVAEEKPGATRLSLSAAFLCTAGSLPCVCAAAAAARWGIRQRPTTRRQVIHGLEATC